MIAVRGEAQIVGQIARVARLSSGIVGRGRILRAANREFELELEKPILPGSEGEVYLEVYAGHAMVRSTANIEQSVGTRLIVSVPGQREPVAHDEPLWWTKSKTRGFVDLGYSEREIAFKSVGLKQAAFDSSWPLEADTDYKMTVVTETFQTPVVARLLDQTMFGGVVMGLIEVSASDRVGMAKWRHFAAEATGIDLKYLSAMG